MIAVLGEDNEQILGLNSVPVQWGKGREFPLNQGFFGGVGRFGSTPIMDVATYIFKHSESQVRVVLTLSLCSFVLEALSLFRAVHFKRCRIFFWEGSDVIRTTNNQSEQE